MKTHHTFIYIICVLLAGLGLSPALHALPPTTYAPNSVLASGRWVQISVTQTGPHRISVRKLAEWGFRDPSKVRIHGYGGARISDVLSADTYVDDLPQVPVIADEAGLTFYAIGPVFAKPNANNVVSRDRNPYSSFGYYYLTESADTERLAFEPGGDPCDASEATDQAVTMLLHEQELTSPGNSGRMMVGENFVYTRSQDFDFKLVDAVPGSEARVAYSFVASTPSASTVEVAVNGTALPYAGSDRLSAVSGSEVFGTQASSTKTFDISATSPQDLRVTITHKPVGAVSKANLDYIEINYLRQLNLPASGSISFSSNDNCLKVSGVNAVVWDVTDQQNVKVMEMSASGAWRNRYYGVRSYEAFFTSAALPQPELVGEVANQNLHSLESPEMVIVTPRAYLDAANRLAQLHRSDPNDPLTVEVVLLDQVLHEFSSGTFDPGAIRRLLKMFYDRGSLRFALMMGKGTFDNRALTSVGKAMKSPMPLWVSENSLNESSSYSTDDFIAFLEDDSGQRPGNDKLSVALGRIPCTSAAEAKLAVDKIEQYRNKMPRSDWRNRVLILADDGNKGVHMTQSESMCEKMLADPASELMLSKVYIDAYEWQNGSFPVARSEFYRNLNDGAMLWAYIGHGSPTALCGDNMVTYQDMSTQFFLRHWPFCYAATCSFLKWDTDITSAAEMLYFTEEGGIIGAISALRPVYITLNGNFTQSFGAEFARRREGGRTRTMGEVYQSTKNSLKNDENRLRYVFMGDPALHTVMPDAGVRLDSINGEAVTVDAQVTLKARQQLILTGTVLHPDGTPMTEFNGRVSATLYDAERSVVSNGRGEDGEQVPFDVHGDMLFTTGGTVTGGKFTVKVQMPSDVADNFRPATLNLYALSDSTEAAGVCRDIYVFGYDETAPIDEVAPVIHSMSLNHETFADGGKVNSTPMLLATVSDDSGINLSSAGVGHQITVTIDGKTSYSNVSGYFTPDPEPVAGAMSGSIAYTIPALDEGEHEIRLRVWDISGNYSERTITCQVVDGLAPKIFDVYTDTNPASTSASFYVTHNRPEERMNVEVTVYNLLGQQVWKSSTSGRSDMHTSAPLKWDLTDTAGRRVARGIYLYRAEISTTDGSKHATKSRKIAVTAQ